jgi:hypothetical protein
MINVGKLRTITNRSATNSTDLEPSPSMTAARSEMFAMLHHSSSPCPIEKTTAQRNQRRTVERDLARSEDCCEGLE